MSDRIPVEPFDDDEGTPGETLRPAGIEDAMRPLSAILGEDVVVFIRDDVDAANVAMPLVPVAASALVAMVPALIGKDRPGVTLVSDGHMSHAITVLEEKGGRLIFFDPWNVRSFLQEGRNISGVQARTEGQGKYSVTADELARVIIAEGVAGLSKVSGMLVAPSWDEFRSGDFYTFFHLRPDGDPVPHDDGFALPHKPGGFAEFLDLGFELDAAGRVRAGVVEINQAWLLGPNRMMGMDFLKSFVAAMVPQAFTLSPVGITTPATLPSPDLHMAGALHDALASIMRGRQPAPSRRLDRLGPLFGVIAGQSEEVVMPLFFTRLHAISRGGTLLLRIEHRN
jgi:hypothetical protein